MYFPAAVKRVPGTLLVCLGLGLPAAGAVAQDGVAELKRAIEQLQAQNREMARRLAVLEAKEAGEAGARQAVRTQPAPAKAAAPAARTARTEPARANASGSAPPVRTADTEQLEQRVRDLETAKTAQEDAVRTIIRSSLATTGPRINDYVTLGGSLEITAGRSSDFSGQWNDSVTVSTAELDLEVRANDWITGYLTLAYDNGTNVIFPTSQGFNAGVDRITLDKAYVMLGDVQRFPIFAKAGLDYLAFGTSTGTHRTDVLSIVNPLTIEAFELRKVGIGVGFGLPTPAPSAPAPPIVVPQVRPQVVNPLVGSLARSLGYQPPPVRPAKPTPFTFPPEQPPFYGFVNLYDANTTDAPNRRLTSAINARLGYRAKGNCGSTYPELGSSWVCPWALDVNLDYDSSIFDSLFLQSQYLPFLSQIGTIPAIALSARMNFGPFLLVGEWNGAIKTAKFLDGLGQPVSMTPSAWQASIGYQFDWNPWVETIGAQGDYIAVGYSGTYGLGGVTEIFGTTATRVGFLPQTRVSITAGEWVMENTKLAIEYSHNWDYPVSKGGTGKQADGIFVALTYNW